MTSNSVKVIGNRVAALTCNQMAEDTEERRREFRFQGGAKRKDRNQRRCIPLERRRRRNMQKLIVNEHTVIKSKLSV